MSEAANKREFLEAAHALVKASVPSAENITSVCETLSRVLSDMTGKQVVVLPHEYEE